MSFALRKPKALRSRDYLSFVRMLPCIANMVRGREIYGVDPAHVSHAYPGWASRGKSQKVSDDRCLPLARDQHDRQHDMSEPVYWATLGVYPPDLCADLQAAYPNVDAGVAVIRQHAATARRKGLHTVRRARDLVEPQDAAPPTATVTVHLGAGRDKHGNVSIILPSLCARGRSTIHAFVDPSAITEADRPRSTPVEGGRE